MQIALGLFVLQLILNALWTPLFFGWHHIGAALADVVLLWLTILATIVAFARVSRPSALCLCPYLAWVTFAAVLNASLWWLNR